MDEVEVRWSDPIATVLAACREAGLPAADREHALSLLARWQRTDEALAWVARRRRGASAIMEVAEG